MPGYLNLPGGVGDRATTPYTALVPAGIDIAIAFRTDNISAYPILFTGLTGSGQSPGYEVYVDTVGLYLGWARPSYADATSTSDTIANGVDYLRRVTLELNNGGNWRARFYTSTDPITTPLGSVSWTLLDTVNGVGTTTIATSDPLSIGTWLGHDIADTYMLDGRIYAIEVKNGIGGAVIWNPDFRTDAQRDSPTQLTDDQGHVWTLEGAAEWIVYLAGSLFTKAPTFFAGTLAFTDKTLTGTLFTRTPTFFPGAVAVADRTLTGTLFARAPLFPTGAVGLVAAPVPAVIGQADEGLRFEAWSMPHVGTLTRKFDFTKLVEGYSLNDRFNDLTDGTLTMPDDAALPSGTLLKDRLFHIDETDHANDVGSMVRVLRGSTPILHYLITRSEDTWSDGEPTHKLALEGLEWILDRVLVPNFDHPADPTVDPDWTYGADSILKNSGLEASGQSLEVQLLWLTGATGGTFTLTYSGQTTSALAWNADWFAVGTALEALSNIQDVTVSGAGIGLSPWTVEFIDPDGDVAAITINTGSLTGPAPVGHVETTMPGGQLDTAGWTTSFNPSTGEPHGTYQNFQVSTAQAHSGVSSLLVNAAAPANPSDFPGVQQILNVTAGRTYRAEVWVYPTFTATFRLRILTTDETNVAVSVGAGTALTANTWNLLTVDPFVIPDWIDQIIYRVGLVDSTDLGDWYVDDAVLAPGFPAATLGTMMDDIRTAALAVGSPLAWLYPTWTTTLDSDGVAWDQDRQWNVNHGQSFLQLFEYARRWNYEFRLRWDPVDVRFEWDMWNPSGGGQTRTGIAVSGKSGVEGAAPIVQRPPGATYVKAEGAYGRWGEYASTTLDDVWGRLEKFHQDRQGVNSDELDELAERIMSKTEVNTAARSVTVADPAILPWTAYEPGDIVTLNLAPKDVKKDLRVAAIVASKRPNDAVPRYDVHFGAVVYSNDTAIAAGLRTLIREFRRPTFTPPAGVPLAELPPPNPNTGFTEVIIAASDTQPHLKLLADYICTGEDDQVTWRQALLDLGATIPDRIGGKGRVKVLDGTYLFEDRLTFNTQGFGNLQFVGEGLPIIRMGYNSVGFDGYCPLIWIAGSNNSVNAPLSFSNIMFDGNNQSNALCLFQSTVSVQPMVDVHECIFINWDKTLWWTERSCPKRFHHNQVLNSAFADGAFWFDTTTVGPSMIYDNLFEGCSGNMVWGYAFAFHALIDRNIQQFGTMVENPLLGVTYNNNYGF